MDITFNCDKCGQSLVIDGAAVGQLVDCPKCKTPLEVPYKSQPPVSTAPPPVPTSQIPSSRPASPPQVSDTKKCPFCAETIKAEARVCRFCGYDLVTGKAAARGAEPASGRTSNPLSKILMVLVIIAAMVGGFFFYHFWKDRPLSTTLEGEVFIVTKGGQNYKLGLVTVGILRADTLKRYLGEEKSDPTHAEARKAYKAAQEVAEKAYRVWSEAVQKGASSQLEEWDEALKKESEAKEAYEELLRNSWSFYQIFVTPDSTKTDADGHFSMSMPGPGRFVLTAKAERDVGDTVERYYWLLPLPPPDRGKIKVTLSNDNLTSPAKMVDSDIAAM